MNRLKRIFVFIIVAALTISNITITQAKSNDVKVEIVSVKNSNKCVKVKVKIKNDSKKAVVYGEDFTVYRKDKKTWKKMKWKEGYGFNSVENVLMKGGEAKKNFYIDKSGIREKIKKNKKYLIKFKVLGKQKKVIFKVK